MDKALQSVTVPLENALPFVVVEAANQGNSINFFTLVPPENDPVHRESENRPSLFRTVGAALLSFIPGLSEAVNLHHHVSNVNVEMRVEQSWRGNSEILGPSLFAHVISLLSNFREHREEIFSVVVKNRADNKCGSFCNFRGSAGETLLHWAALKRNYPALFWLLDVEPMLLACVYSGKSYKNENVLHILASHGDLDVIRVLAKKTLFWESPWEDGGKFRRVFEKREKRIDRFRVELKKLENEESENVVVGGKMVGSRKDQDKKMQKIRNKLEKFNKQQTFLKLLEKHMENSWGHLKILEEKQVNLIEREIENSEGNFVKGDWRKFWMKDAWRVTVNGRADGSFFEKKEYGGACYYGGTPTSIAASLGFLDVVRFFTVEVGCMCKACWDEVCHDHLPGEIEEAEEEEEAADEKQVRHQKSKLRWGFRHLSLQSLYPDFDFHEGCFSSLEHFNSSKLRCWDSSVTARIDIPDRYGNNCGHLAVIHHENFHVVSYLISLYAAGFGVFEQHPPDSKMNGNFSFLQSASELGLGHTWCVEVKCIPKFWPDSNSSNQVKGSNRISPEFIEHHLSDLVMGALKRVCFPYSTHSSPPSPRASAALDNLSWRHKYIPCRSKLQAVSFELHSFSDLVVVDDESNTEIVIDNEKHPTFLRAISQLLESHRPLIIQNPESPTSLPLKLPISVSLSGLPIPSHLGHAEVNTTTLYHHRNWVTLRDSLRPLYSDELKPSYFNRNFYNLDAGLKPEEVLGLYKKKESEILNKMRGVGNEDKQRDLHKALLNCQNQAYQWQILTGLRRNLVEIVNSDGLTPLTLSVFLQKRELFDALWRSMTRNLNRESGQPHWTWGAVCAYNYPLDQVDDIGQVMDDLATQPTHTPFSQVFRFSGMGPSSDAKDRLIEESSNGGAVPLDPREGFLYWQSNKDPIFSFLTTFLFRPLLWWFSHPIAAIFRSPNLHHPTVLHILVAQNASRMLEPLETVGGLSREQLYISEASGAASLATLSLARMHEKEMIDEDLASFVYYQHQHEAHRLIRGHRDRNISLSSGHESSPSVIEHLAVRKWDRIYSVKFLVLGVTRLIYVLMLWVFLAYRSGGSLRLTGCETSELVDLPTDSSSANNGPTSTMMCAEREMLVLVYILLASSLFLFSYNCIPCLIFSTASCARVLKRSSKGLSSQSFGTILKPSAFFAPHIQPKVFFKMTRSANLYNASHGGFFGNFYTYSILLASGLSFLGALVDIWGGGWGNSHIFYAFGLFFGCIHLLYYLLASASGGPLFVMVGNIVLPTLLKWFMIMIPVSLAFTGHQFLLDAGPRNGEGGTLLERGFIYIFKHSFLGFVTDNVFNNFPSRASFSDEHGLAKLPQVGTNVIQAGQVFTIINWFVLVYLCTVSLTSLLVALLSNAFTEQSNKRSDFLVERLRACLLLESHLTDMERYFGIKELDRYFVVNNVDFNAVFGVNDNKKWEWPKTNKPLPNDLLKLNEGKKYFLPLRPFFMDVMPSFKFQRHLYNSPDIPSISHALGRSKKE